MADQALTVPDDLVELYRYKPDHRYCRIVTQRRTFFGPSWPAAERAWAGAVAEAHVPAVYVELPEV